MNRLASSYFKRSVLMLLLAALSYGAVPLAVAADVRLPLMLANVYRPSVQMPDYWVSEKYDGVRAFWDGQKLLTRGGQPINAPWPASRSKGRQNRHFLQTHHVDTTHLR